MKYKRYFISGNSNKYAEIAKYIPNLEMLNTFEIPEIQSLIIEDIIKSKIMAALKKAVDKTAFILVEDTGLYLNALNNFPGPLVKFMLESIGDEGIFNICDKLADLKAFAVTSFGIYNPVKQSISYYSAKVNGTITYPKGECGFGWDRIFIPEGSDKTFAEMSSIEEKNRSSMRYLAFQKFISDFMFTDD